LLLINVLHLPLSFPAGFLIEHLGMKRSLGIAAFLVVLGSWTRVFINKNYYFLVLGHLFIGIGNPLI